MPRKKRNNRPRDSTGHFVSNYNSDPEGNSTSEIDSTESANGEDLQASNFATYLENKSLMEESSSDEEGYIGRAKAMFGKPETWGEHRVRQKSEKWVEELRQQAVRAAEATLDGQMEKAGVKRGPYRQGGSLAARSIRRKAKRPHCRRDWTVSSPRNIREQREKSVNLQSTAFSSEISSQVHQEKQWKSQVPLIWTPGPSLSTSVKDPLQSLQTWKWPTLRVELFIINSTSDKLSKLSEKEGNNMEMDESVQAPQGPGHEPEDPPSASESISSNDKTDADSKDLESQEWEDNEDAEWVDVVTEESFQRLLWQDLEALAEEGLKKARKRQDYSSEVLFVALSDFYTWVGHQGRGAAALRAARACR
ncbi:hypothetical protein M407DRAFT_30668 [Tulasnella calospora MUT 4182]|uniref:Uncharacterized protein n=1 Tax=Tulasnella calospora MUT 4182 TaxID=1051891 RepID=A0A0C3KDY7_9AGAM|nr:hypothetical protein M407DRAFT_30668 [Tulasnella calospora MUT 4182]